CSFYKEADPQYLHSFPTRRSSDLPSQSSRRIVLMKQLLGVTLLPLVCVCFLNGQTGNTVKYHATIQDVKYVYAVAEPVGHLKSGDRKSTRLNSSHGSISYAVFCLN